MRSGEVWFGLVSLARNFYMVRRGGARWGGVRRGVAWPGMVWSGFSGEKFYKVGQGGAR